jgi:uncharacterized membrane protein YccC
MTAGRGLAALAETRRAAASWPPLLRDVGAAGGAVLCICLGELAAMALPIAPEVLLALPGVLVAALVLGWPSAVFALLVAAAAVATLAPFRVAGLVGGYAHEPLKLAAMSAALIAACLGARLWARRRERRAAVLMDACARDAVRRIADAEAETDAAHAALRRAEAALAEARRAMARGVPDAAFEEARRQEGGI